MSRNRTVVAAAAALAIALTAIATTAMAATEAGGSAPPHTLQVVATTLVFTGPTTPPAAGDRFTFYESDTGGDTGHDYVDCVVTNSTGQTLCHAEFVLGHGTISVEAVFDANQTTLRDTGIITGGTGNYLGASGVTDIDGPVDLTRFTFHFSR